MLSRELGDLVDWALVAEEKKVVEILGLGVESRSCVTGREMCTDRGSSARAKRVRSFRRTHSGFCHYARLYLEGGGGREQMVRAPAVPSI